jgi:hypothetical protein
VRKTIHLVSVVAAFAGAVAALVFIPAATIAIIVMVGSVWGADKAIKRFQKYDTET